MKTSKLKFDRNQEDKFVKMLRSYNEAITERFTEGLFGGPTVTLEPGETRVIARVIYYNGLPNNSKTIFSVGCPAGVSKEEVEKILNRYDIRKGGKSMYADTITAEEVKEARIYKWVDSLDQLLPTLGDKLNIDFD